MADSRGVIHEFEYLLYLLHLLQVLHFRLLLVAHHSTQKLVAQAWHTALQRLYLLLQRIHLLHPMGQLLFE